ncbi:uncharacterized protein TNCV_3761021 [Trichonephila clavipes]|nr:uncharacterized protein TNCV_3761021 [Trichonephila clavipes]
MEYYEQTRVIGGGTAGSTLVSYCLSLATSWATFAYDAKFDPAENFKLGEGRDLRNEEVAAVAEWYRHRIVAGFVTSSSPVPLKTRRVGQRCTLNLSRAETSSRWCGVVVRRAQVWSTSLDHGSKLRGPSPKALMQLNSATLIFTHSLTRNEESSCMLQLGSSFRKFADPGAFVPHIHSTTIARPSALDPYKQYDGPEGGVVVADTQKRIVVFADTSPPILEQIKGTDK